MNFVKMIEATWDQSKDHIVPLLINSLVLVVVSTVTLGILAPVCLAGYCGSILKMVRFGREPKAADIFSEMRLFFPLLIFTIVVGVATFLGYSLLVLPGIVISVGILYVCLYMIPLMVDKNIGIVDALGESWSMSKKGKIIDHIIVIVIIMGLQAIGSSFIVGAFVTTPLSTVFLMNAYEFQLKNN